MQSDRAADRLCVPYNVHRVIDGVCDYAMFDVWRRTNICYIIYTHEWQKRTVCEKCKYANKA